jgi:hypothetical protein
MMSTDSAEIHVGDIGTELRLVVYNQDGSVMDNLGSSTQTHFWISKPNGEVLDVDADLYTDGTDGILTYTTVDGDVDVAGIYKIQAVVTFSAGLYHSSIQTFRVHSNLI